MKSSSTSATTALRRYYSRRANWRSKIRSRSRGPSAELLTIDASGITSVESSSVFNISDGKVASVIDILIQGLTLTGAQNSAIRNRENLTLTSMTLSGNKSNSGGALWMELVSNSPVTGLNMIDSTIVNNVSTGSVGGAIYFRGDGDQISIRNTVISGNKVDSIDFGGGGAIYVAGPRNQLEIIDTRIENNTALNGGGVYILNFAGGDVHIIGSEISHNTALLGGGGIYAGGDHLQIDRSTITENVAGDSGGGLRFSGFILSEVVINESTISGNSATGGGGGIDFDGRILSITQSTFSDNSSYVGGAIFASYLVLNNSTVSGNSARSVGGGIYSRHSATIINSTISLNSAGYSGGGISAKGTMLEGSLVANNTATTMPDVAFRIGIDSGLFKPSHSLIGYFANPILAEAPLGAPDANGNLIGGPVHGVIDPLLGPLADNGGPTFTHALLPGSPAINAGDPTLILGTNGVPEFDQRGAPFTRIAGGRIDIGAYESQPAAGTFDGDFDGDGDVDGRDFLAWQRNYGAAGPQVTKAQGDATGDHDVDANDLAVWQATYGRQLSGLTAQQLSVGPVLNAESQEPQLRLPLWPLDSRQFHVAERKSDLVPPDVSVEVHSLDQALENWTPPRRLQRTRHRHAPYSQIQSSRARLGKCV